MNEILGRDKSDDFLCRVVTCIQPMLKKDEIICRDSADVFYLLLNDTNETRWLDEFMICLRKFARIQKIFDMNMNFVVVSQVI